MSSIPLNMEIVSYKVNQSYYCVWKENKFIIEDLEANKSVSIYETQLQWTQHTISDLLTNLLDRFFNAPLVNSSVQKVNGRMGKFPS